MIAEPENADDDSEPRGVLGDGALRPGKYNMALARRAIREDWPMSAEMRTLLINQMALVVGRSPDERNKIGAARVMVAADSVNVRREEMDQRDEHKAQPDLVDINVRSQILEDPDFYGNYDQLAALAEASGTDPFASRPVQADDLRPEVGENGNGSSRDD